MRTTTGAEDRLAAFTHELSRAGELTEPRVVRSELATMFEHGVPNDVGTVPAAELPTVPRGKRMLTTLSGVLATITGKVVLGTAVAAASVGAAHSSGIVDVPGLPDTAPPVESPDTESPDTESPDTESPDTESPDTESPDIESPDIESPDIESPDIESPDIESPDIDIPGPDEATEQGSDSQPGTTGAPDDPGVDGSDVADRATSGEPQEDGKEFGTSIADEATEGTPAEGKPGGDGGGRPEESPGADVADENTPEEAPGGSDTADEHTPDTTGPPSAPADRP